VDNYSKRLVFCGDILGYSNKFSGLSTEQKVLKYNEIITAVKSSCHSFNEDGEDPKSLLKRVNYYWFSDFFILFSDDIPVDNSLDEIQEISDHIELKIVKFLQSVKIIFLHFLSQGLPLRGAVDFGEIFFDPNKNIVLGDTIINTVKLSDSHEWAGIALTPSCSKMLSQYSRAKEYLVAYSVPLKKDTQDELVVIDWPKDASLQTRLDSKDYVSQQFKKGCNQLDESAETKLENTINFLESRVTTQYRAG
jgi:hypothetical protein